MLNRRPILSKKSFLDLKKKKRNNFADNYIFFILSEESSEYFGITLVSISFWNMNKEEKIGSLHS
uniref:Uncharacterized protein n=1 Tax=Nicotiana tabacum TaxID=4097 RepID=Q36598_TOBAC|nr:unknown protein [Nicotiana tabacum]prf//1102209D ORF 4 [Nicotiana sp.]